MWGECKLSLPRVPSWNVPCFTSSTRTDDGAPLDGDARSQSGAPPPPAIVTDPSADSPSPVVVGIPPGLPPSPALGGGSSAADGKGHAGGDEKVPGGITMSEVTMAAAATVATHNLKAPAFWGASGFRTYKASSKSGAA